MGQSCLEAHYNYVQCRVASCTETLLYIAPSSPVIPGGGGGGGYLSMLSCYYQMLVEVPRPTVARGIQLYRAKLRHVHRLMCRTRSYS